MNVNIVYWSGTGNTEAMANFIKEGAESSGASAKVINVSDAKEEDLDCDILCLGCPSMGDEVLEEDEFEPYITSIEGKMQGKKVALFGSFGWGAGEWMADFEARMKDAGATLVRPSLIVRDAPEGDECKEFGAEIAK